MTVSNGNINIFNLKSNELHLNTSTTGYFHNPYAKTYFLFDSSERQFIKLNYSGPMSKLKIYNYYYYNSKIIYFIHHKFLMIKISFIAMRFKSMF